MSFFLVQVCLSELIQLIAVIRNSGYNRLSPRKQNLIVTPDQNLKPILGSIP